MQYLPFAVAMSLIAAEFLAAKSNRRAHAEGGMRIAWTVLYRWRWAIGVPLAVVSVFVSYPYTGATEVYRVFGFPLPAAAFDQAGHDYVSFLTIPIFMANAIIWYFMPQILLFCWAFMARRNRPADA